MHLFLLFALLYPQLSLASTQRPLSALRIKLHQSSEGIRSKLDESKRAFEATVHERFLHSESVEERLKAAIFLGTLYKGQNTRLSQQYLATAALLQDPFKTSEFREMIALARAENAAEYQFNQESIELIKSLLKRSKKLPWRMVKSGFETVMDYYHSQQDPMTFLEVFKDYYHSLPNFVLDSRYLQMAAMVLKERKEYYYPSYKRVLEVLASWYPLNGEAEWALNQLDTLAQEGRYRFKLGYLRKLYLNGTISQEARQKILGIIRRPILKDNKKTPRRMDNLELVKFFVRIREYGEALALAKTTFESSQSQYQRWLAEQWIAFIHGRMGNHETAIAMYERSLILENRPNTFFIENYAENLMKNQRHVQAASKYLKALKKKNHYRLRWYAFWNSYAGKMNQDALDIINGPERVFNSYPLNDKANEYWNGKINLQQGKQIDAIRNFKDVVSDHQHSYYSTMIKIQYQDITPVSQHPIVSRKLHDEHLPFGESDLKLALDWGFAPQAVDFNEIEESPLPIFGAGPLPLAISVTSISTKEQEERLRKSYPRILEDKVGFIAEELELDPYILYALMRAESSFNPVAVSNVGARGIMQMMPYTAVKLSEFVNDQRFSLEELSDPVHSIFYGALYFKYLLEIYKGNLFVAIAAYNAGPKSVNSWLESCTHCQVDDFVELIPFKETRLYVKKVIKNYATYKDLYESQPIMTQIPELPVVPAEFDSEAF
ncbi:lytic transglycosylase domain-containing protein [Pseudobacteriovorax antillogorgiicola]|uniref:Transglycosylase SLT domain-containing protein n=1 Tax=Pseudobacteriovorax antillogorgiicola TaxID=1513793 RepID=A0A1Y6BD68_9BACT|nr:lytic transglycosylase domain-containing protein [Pseudobacteriovorax antillogorgiicola]TCS58534.1 transglycosylase-like protein with SLT domain [Pseudobacteriovorax antillogorgiicola]SME97866.1 Transglycosylase SLT domain-containing protein [Pseudobacteriovorax antillogorgiicola]